eukprot:CAMPEP_0178447000 /NCGR_PEP_ID=MMETSP0689_2-20121128/41137_1 /TAXON_ID=160604 /ORGANISM="Amphidinium massartii, Strain CS-259" /LENGTH=212 /DNA_ID=CAMNT_0020071929 /DNA_START=273 /DNA_END=908 /DNA_ORIENTATION=+
MPKVPLTLSNARHERRLFQRHVLQRSTSFAGLVPDASTLDRRWWSVVPLSVADTLGSFDFYAFTITWALLLLPVPLARIILKDHTPEQVVAGALIGIVEAFAWWLCIRKFIQEPHNQEPHNHLLGTRFWGICVHNYALPRFVVRCKCCRLLAKLEDAMQIDNAEEGRWLSGGTDHWNSGSQSLTQVGRSPCNMVTKVISTEKWLLMGDELER